MYLSSIACILSGKNKPAYETGGVSGQVDGRKARQRLLQLRRSFGWTQQDLADASGVSRAVIARLEAGPEAWETARTTTLSRLAEALGVPIDYLTGEEDDMEPEADYQRAQRPNARSAAQAPGSEALDPAKPITDRQNLPRPAHIQEPWDDQARCFLEGQRAAYEEWINNPKALYGDLLDLMYEAAEHWAEQHGVPIEEPKQPGYETQDAQVLGPEDRVMEAPRRLIDSILSIPNRFASQIRWPVVTVKPKAREAGGQPYDLVRDAHGRFWHIPCRHQTPSADPDDHLFLFRGPDGLQPKRPR